MFETIQPDDRQPEISIIIPCYRSRRTVGFTLKSINDQLTSRTFETIVVDSSGEEIAQWIQTRFPRVRVVASSQRLFPGAARNLGASHARGHRLAFLDADTIALDDWLEKLSQAVDRHSRIDIAGGAVDNANPQSLAAKILHWVEFSEFLPGRSHETRSFLSSSNLLMSRNVYERAGGFPEKLPMSEDLVFFRRLAMEDVSFLADTGVRHYHRSRWAEISRHLRELGYWSGRVRTSFSTKGSWMSGLPLSAFLLPPYRTVKICTRIASSAPSRTVEAALFSPLLFWAVTVWTSGFHRGLCEPTLQESRLL